MTDTALALRPDALTQDFGALPAPTTYETKPVEVRAELRTAAARFRQAVQAALAAKDAELDGDIATAFAMHRELTTAKKAACAPLLEMRKRVDALLVGYDDADTRIALEASQRYAEEEAAAQEAQDVAIAAGDVEAALAVPPVSAPPSGPLKTAGLSYRETWHIEITDMLTFLRHIVNDNPGLTHLVQGNDTALNRYAAGLKGAVKLPGTRLRVTKTPVTGRK